MYDPDKGLGVGSLDFFGIENNEFELTEEVVEKWWCLGDTRNRKSMWVQGAKLQYKY